jgi:class 3 adenylate cyclase/predicted ATPase
MSAPDDVALWLDRLGLAEYAPLFAEQAIDRAVLVDLSDQDLKDLGIPLGHRKRLLKAIAALAEPAPAPPESPPRPDAERRQLTVLFCDLVGSTELSTRLDPEDIGALIRAYQACCADVVKRWDGHVAKYMGDGVLVYFGYPKAHEDDAERAVRAGLDLVTAIARLPTGTDTPLAARVGIATGLVMVGELIGEGAAREQAVVGETPNLAARLQAIAAPGSVAIAESTRRLLGGLFELTDLGPKRLKGFAEPLAAFRVAGEGRAKDRFAALHGQRLTPLVGREHELAMLMERWARAKDGEGQVVLIAGEPGIGKSRLLRALREELRSAPHLALSHFCSPYHTNSALHPIITQLERAAGFAPGDAPEAKRAKLEALLGQATAQLDEALPLLAALLGIPAGERGLPIDLSPQRQKQRTLEVLIEQLAGLARARPVLELYEDLHWVDPSTLELLDLLVQRVRTLPVLAVLTYRPEFTPPWSGQAHVTALPLNRLGRRQAAAIVERITGGKALPAEVLDQIVPRTDGVPLFVEELTKTVLESGLLIDAGDRYELAGPLPPLAIPATLHDSLMARLDRLAPVKEVAQTAAVIGREFSHELIAAVSPLSEADLSTALERLAAAELIFRRGTPPAAIYSFKHALVRDAAYESLLRSRRRNVHARVAAALEEQCVDAAAAEPEVLAYHCAQAGLFEKAVDYRYLAGQQAIARSAMAEAVVQLGHGIETLAGFPDESERRGRELDLQIALGGALIAAMGYSADQTGRAFARARELGEEAGDVHRLMPVLNGQMLFHLERNQYQSAFDIATRMLELAQVDAQGDPALLIPAHRALSLTSYELRRFAAARDHADQVLALYEPDRHRALASLYAFDQRIVALGYLAVALFVLGYPDRAHQRSEQQLVEARELGHSNTLAQALSRACIFCRMSRDDEGIREAAEALVALAAEHGLPYFQAIGMLHRGWVIIERGGVEDGIAELERAAAAARDAQARWSPAYVSCVAAEAHALAGRRREAATCAAEALSQWDEVQSPWFLGDQHWHKGQLLLRLAEPNRGRAESCFRHAIEFARNQEAKMWELRAATSLARLWAEQGKRGQALDLLAPVYGWFTEGFDTADLKDAGALLDELC